MKTKKPAYKSPLRDQQVADTKARILEALAALIQRDGVNQVSFKALAQEAGVTEITVYRHFKDRQVLLREFWYWMDQRLGNRGMPQTQQAMLEDIPVVFAGFDELNGLMRAALLTEEGRSMRMSMQQERRAGFEKALADATAHCSPEQRLQACAVIQLLYSGYAWMSMHDHWGLDGKAAANASQWAISTLLADLKSRHPAPPATIPQSPKEENP